MDVARELNQTTKDINDAPCAAELDALSFDHILISSPGKQGDILVFTGEAEVMRGTPCGDNQEVPAKKKKRRVLAPSQVEILEASFGINQNPTSAVRGSLGLQLGIPERNVQIWFQNRRAKYKRGDAPVSTARAKRCKADSMLSAASATEQGPKSKASLTTSALSAKRRVRRNRITQKAVYPTGRNVRTTLRPPTPSREQQQQLSPASIAAAPYPSPNMMACETLAAAAQHPSVARQELLHNADIIYDEYVASPTGSPDHQMSYERMMQLHSPNMCGIDINIYGATCDCYPCYLPCCYIPGSEPQPTGSLSPSLTDEINFSSQEDSQGVVSCLTQSACCNGEPSTHEYTKGEEFSLFHDGTLPPLYFHNDIADTDRDAPSEPDPDTMVTTEHSMALESQISNDVSTSPTPVAGPGSALPSFATAPIFADSLVSDAYLSLPIEYSYADLYHPQAVEIYPGERAAAGFSTEYSADANMPAPPCQLHRSQSFSDTFPAMPPQQLRRRHSIAATPYDLSLAFFANAAASPTAAGFYTPQPPHLTMSYDFGAQNQFFTY
ncbi:hypothetical protein DFJ77DRAFT_477471 [Powellomyces hirtus]|nr:hypothetical protein DFJ77DRAFT_477471 [Powellomyces hirtus]